MWRKRYFFLNVDYSTILRYGGHRVPKGWLRGLLNKDGNVGTNCTQAKRDHKRATMRKRAMAPVAVLLSSFKSRFLFDFSRGTRNPQTRDKKNSDRAKASSVKVFLTPHVAMRRNHCERKTVTSPTPR